MRSVPSSTSKAIKAWLRPQNSAHTPRKVPARSALATSRLVRPGIMSILPARPGIQKLWSTSVAVSSKTTVRPTGMRISFAVTRGLRPASS